MSVSPGGRAAALALGIVLGLSAILVARLAVGQGPPKGPAAEAPRADVVCPGGAVAGDLAVAATPEGAPLSVWSDGAGMILYVSANEGAPIDNLILTLGAGANQLELPLPPGTSRFGCFEAPFDASSLARDQLASLTVEDPEGLWRPADLDCREVRKDTLDPVWSDDSSPVPPDSLEDRATAELEWLRQTDQLVESLYPDGTWAEGLLVVRDGAAVASLVRLSNPLAATGEAATDAALPVRLQVCADIKAAA